MNPECLSRYALAVLLSLGCAPFVGAQYPYSPYSLPRSAGPGITLMGGAQVLQAQGQLPIQMEQARQERQKYYQDKVKTKRMAFDEAKYERENTPTVTEEQARVLNLQVQRVLNQANPAEIQRGDTLNTLMPYIKLMMDQGAYAPPAPIYASVLKQINVKTGNAESAPGAGMLKDAGKLSWPLALRGPRQKQIDQTLPMACSQAANGTLEPATYNKIVSGVQSMKEDLRKQYHKEQISGSTFLSGQSYLDSLLSSLKVLERPDAAKYFDGSYAAQGNTVPELINNMLGQGLTFGPAAPGGAAAYTALHNAFVSYARSAQGGTGFRVSQQAPPPRPVNQKGL